MTADVDRAVDHLFRRSAVAIVTALSRALGADRIDLAEEVTQEALIKCLEVWRFRGVPDNPSGWLYRVAYNRALDVLRRDQSFREKLALLPPPETPGAPGARGGAVFADHELELIFLCCHPALAPESRVALTLKVACGFSVGEIAGALLTDPGAVSQRIVRAKRALRKQGAGLALSDADTAIERLDSVLVCLYLLFTEGHSAHGGDQPVREDLCAEAIRLGKLLAVHPSTNVPSVHALLALMCLQASRLPARRRGDAVLLLEDQDWTLWDRSLISAGLRYLDAAACGDQLTTYHVEAAIAAEFVFGRPDWRRILRLYDQLLDLTPTPVVRMNRAVALGKVEGPRAALRELVPLFELPTMRGYHLLPALVGAFHGECGDSSRARAAYLAALRLPINAAERRFIEVRLRSLPVEDNAVEEAR